jgi:hypothetical protein
VDHIAGAGSLTSECEAGTREAGAIKTIAIVPATENLMTMTVTGVVHLGVEPWCTDTLPHKITGGDFFFTEMFTTVTLALDKAASFGSCAPTREMTIGVLAEQLSEQFPYAAEVVG